MKCVSASDFYVIVRILYHKIKRIASAYYLKILLTYFEKNIIINTNQKYGLSIEQDSRFMKKRI